MEKNHKKAIFAGGCFWCIQDAFDHIQGVISTAVGYIGGKKKQPSYEEVSQGTTGHVEAVEIVYDPAKVSYERLLDRFWQEIEPSRSEGQFCDIGAQYQPIIFYRDEQQKILAEASKRRLQDRGVIVVVEIKPATTFYPAEDDHQKYYLKRPIDYQLYKKHSGRG